MKLGLTWRSGLLLAVAAGFVVYCLRGDVIAGRHPFIPDPRLTGTWKSLSEPGIRFIFAAGGGLLITNHGTPLPTTMRYETRDDLLTIRDLPDEDDPSPTAVTPYFIDDGVLTLTESPLPGPHVLKLRKVSE